MKRNRRVRLVTLAAAMVTGFAALGGGCDQDVREAKRSHPNPPADVPPTQPLTQPAEAVLAAADPEPAAVPETKPAEPVLAFLMLDGLGAHFPPTKLMIHDEGGGRVRVELFSDLPKSAIKEYDGNELYFEMDLKDAAGPQEIDGATWRYKSTSSDRSDSPNGIFLDGQRRHLQPDDVLLKFERRGGQLLAQIMGQFRAFEPGTPDALAPFVGVRGELTVELVQSR
jgi:hypothetical protein